MRLRRTVLLALSALFAAALFARAQAPAPASTGASAPDPAAVNKLLEGEESSTYTYDPAGRRDPFRSLLVGRAKTGGEELPNIDELALQGIWRVKSGFVAQMLGPGNKNYLLRKGDQLADGEVLNITTNEIVFRQNVNDPTMLKPFREVVRELIPTNAK